MKRKYDIMKMMNIEVKPKPILKVEIPRALPCQICKNPVEDYAKCTSPYVYCSIDCLEILILSEKNDYLHTDTSKTFKRVKSEDDLMSYDD